MNIFFDVETCGLDPFVATGRVTLIGLMYENNETIFFHSESEKDLLEAFWSFVASNQATYVGFNVLTFDFPYLLKRSIVCGVRPFMPFKRWLYDLRNLIDSSPFAKGTLGGICVLFSGEHKYESLGGEEVIQLFHDKNYEKLKEYLKQDLILTKILYNRLIECGLV